MVLVKHKGESLLGGSQNRQIEYHSSGTTPENFKGGGGLSPFHGPVQFALF